MSRTLYLNCGVCSIARLWTNTHVLSLVLAQADMASLVTDAALANEAGVAIPTTGEPRTCEQTPSSAAALIWQNPAASRAPPAPLSSQRRWLGNDAVSTIIARASRRLRASQIAPLLRILDQLEIGIMRQPEDAADDLCGRRSHGVSEQPPHIGLSFGLQARRTGLAGKQCPRVRRHRELPCARARGTRGRTPSRRFRSFPAPKPRTAAVRPANVRDRRRPDSSSGDCR